MGQELSFLEVNNENYGIERSFVIMEQADQRGASMVRYTNSEIGGALPERQSHSSNMKISLHTKGGLINNTVSMMNSHLEGGKNS